MKKMLVFFTMLSLSLASCGPASSLGGASQPGQIPASGGVPQAAASLSMPTAPVPITATAAPVQPVVQTPTATQPQLATNAQNSQAATATPIATLPPVPSGKSGIPNFDHIVVIMLENRDYQTAMDGTHMPLLATLAKQNVLLSNYFAVAHPSLPNYIALMSGSTQGITSDCTTCFLNQLNLADEIEASGRAWKAYLEDMPSPCFIGDSGKYAQKHNPFIYFDSIRLNAARCDRSILPLTSLDSDLANKQLPNFSFIMPNLCNSGHDCSAAVADNWINAMVTKLQASPALGINSLIIVAFDEGSDKDPTSCCGLPTPAGGQVAVMLISPTALPDMTDNTPYSHYSLLKTILTAWNLPDLGASAQAQPILAPWTGQVSPAPTP
jgi:phosphatidylinositol-3-phosphatase